jgi:hypothetical protein
MQPSARTFYRFYFGYSAIITTTYFKIFYGKKGTNSITRIFFFKMKC